MSGISTSFPIRPSLSPLLVLTGSAWGIICVVEWGMWDLHLNGGALPVWLPWFALGIIFIAVLPLFFGRLRSVAVMPVAFVFVGLVIAVCSVLYWNAWMDDLTIVRQSFSSQSPCLIEITGDPVEGDHGIISTAESVLSGRVVSLRVVWPDGGEPFYPGHLIRARGRVSLPSDDEAGRWSHRNGFVGMVSLSEVQDAGYASDLRGLVAPFRDASFTRLKALGGEAGGLLAGVLIGQSTLYSGTELEQDFRSTGLAHLMAVSGSHLVVVVLVFGWVCRFLPLPRSA